MTPTEQFSLANLFAGTMARIDATINWPMSDYYFAQAANSLAHNSIAKRFQIREGRSFEYKELLSLMMRAGFIDYLAPAYTHMRLKIVTPRGVQLVLKRSGTTYPEQVEAEELLRTQLSMAGV